MEKTTTIAEGLLTSFKQKIQELSNGTISAFQENPQIDHILQFKASLGQLEKDTLREAQKAGIHNQLELVKELQSLRLESIAVFHKVLDSTK